MFIRQTMHFTSSQKRIAFYCFKVVMQRIHLYTSNTLHCPTSFFISCTYIYIYMFYHLYIYIYIYWDICIHQSTLPVQCHSTFQFPMSPGSRLHTQPLLRKHISMAPWCYIPPTPSIATSTPPCAAFWMKESFRIRVAKLGMDILQGLDFWRYFSDDMVQTFFELDLLKILKWR